MDKKSNDQKIIDYKKAKIKKWAIIIMYMAVIVLEILALFSIVDMLWGCILFVLIYLFKKII
jgi:hypothetical protein